jgi:hypothetical protein
VRANPPFITFIWTIEIYLSQHVMLVYFLVVELFYQP